MISGMHFDLTELLFLSCFQVCTFNVTELHFILCFKVCTLTTEVQFLPCFQESILM